VSYDIVYQRGNAASGYQDADLGAEADKPDNTESRSLTRWETQRGPSVTRG
jgi:hypothetical protein